MAQRPCPPETCSVSLFFGRRNNSRAAKDVGGVFTGLFLPLVSAQVAHVSHDADSEDGWRAGPKSQLEDVAAQVEIKKERKNQKLGEGMSQRGDPSVVKYSVTTTPYLQR